jgi:hypothetical protein
VISAASAGNGVVNGSHRRRLFATRRFIASNGFAA